MSMINKLVDSFIEGFKEGYGSKPIEANGEPDIKFDSVSSLAESLRRALKLEDLRVLDMTTVNNPSPVIVIRSVFDDSDGKLLYKEEIGGVTSFSKDNDGYIRLSQIVNNLEHVDSLSNRLIDTIDDDNKRPADRFKTVVSDYYKITDPGDYLNVTIDGNGIYTHPMYYTNKPYGVLIKVSDE